jgi:hypothetical protein
MFAILKNISSISFPFWNVRYRGLRLQVLMVQICMTFYYSINLSQCNITFSWHMALNYSPNFWKMCHIYLLMFLSSKVEELLRTIFRPRNFFQCFGSLQKPEFIIHTFACKSKKNRAKYVKKSVKSAKSVVKMFVVFCRRINDGPCHSERSEESPVRGPDASLRSA